MCKKHMLGSSATLNQAFLYDGGGFNIPGWPQRHNFVETVLQTKPTRTFRRFVVSGVRQSSMCLSDASQTHEADAAVASSSRGFPPDWWS